MIDKLQNKIQLDCHNSITPPVELDGFLFHVQLLSEINCEIDFHTMMYDEEVKNAKATTAWVRALRSSLAPDRGESSQDFLVIDFGGGEIEDEEEQ
jgi:hypothetical protein